VARGNLSNAMPSLLFLTQKRAFALKGETNTTLPAQMEPMFLCK
jgi:hypothetical protein